MLIECRSFGFKNGIDNGANLLFDLRCLPNPFYIEELKEKTGLDKPVRDYILNLEQSQNYLNKILDMITFLIPMYEEKGNESFKISFGCTGGHHRSVTFALTVCEILKQKGFNTVAVHRDIDIKD